MGQIFWLSSKILKFFEILLHRKKAFTPKSILNTQLIGRVGWILRILSLKAKQLEALLKNGVAYKKKRVPEINM